MCVSADKHCACLFLRGFGVHKQGQQYPAEHLVLMLHWSVLLPEELCITSHVPVMQCIIKFRTQCREEQFQQDRPESPSLDGFSGNMIRVTQSPPHTHFIVPALSLVSRSATGSLGVYSGFIKMDMPKSAYFARSSAGMLGMDSSLIKACAWAHRVAQTILATMSLCYEK